MCLVVAVVVVVIVVTSNRDVILFVSEDLDSLPSKINVGVFKCIEQIIVVGGVRPNVPKPP